MAAAAFVLLVLAQWWIPVGMIRRQEKILQEGKEFRFRIEPVNPSSSPTSEYLPLFFRDPTGHYTGSDRWLSGEKIYATLRVDSIGYANIAEVSRTPPTGKPYIEATVGYVIPEKKQVFVQFPFDRYYIEKGRSGDIFGRGIQPDSAATVYALVAVWEGTAVLKSLGTE